MADSGFALPPSSEDMKQITAQKSGNAKRGKWLPFFFILNAAGLGVLIWLAWGMRSPPGELVVVRTTPAGKVSPERVSEITVEFGAPLDPETVKDDAVRLVPSVPGKVELSQGRILKFGLMEPLAKATRYRISLSPELRGRNGERPPETFYYFNTPPLAVVDVTQAKIEADGSVTVAIEFNGLVNPEELRDHVKLKYRDGAPVDFSPVGGKPDKHLQIHIRSVAQDWIKFLLEKELTGIEGPLGLTKDYHAELHVFATGSSPPANTPPSSPATGTANTPQKVLITPQLRFLGIRARHRYGKSKIEIRTNSPLDASQAKDYVSIKPDLPHNFKAWRQGLLVGGDFAAGTRYRVTLKKGLPAGAAGKLHRSYTRAVWFPDKGKSMRFAFGGGYLSPNGLLKVPVRTVNVEEARLSVLKLYPSNIVEHVLSAKGDYLSQYRTTDLVKRTIKISMKPNHEVETLLDLREVAEPQPRGALVAARNRPLSPGRFLSGFGRGKGGQGVYLECAAGHQDTTGQRLS